MQESQVDVVTTLIADGKPTVAVEPGKSAFHHPPVSAQLLATLYSFTRYAAAALDAPLPKSLAAPGHVIRFVSVQLVRALTWASWLTTWARDRLDAVHHLLKNHRVMGVGTGQFHR